MNITIISVGKVKEKYLRDAIEEYSKRLKRYCKLEILEVSDEKTPDNASEKEEIQIKVKEGEAILRYIKDNAFVIALDLKGKTVSSEELANFISDLGTKGKSDLVFIIGGSLGLSQKVLERADYTLCFSKMTFPHQLFRVMLLRSEERRVGK